MSVGQKSASSFRSPASRASKIGRGSIMSFYTAKEEEDEENCEEKAEDQIEAPMLAGK